MSTEIFRDHEIPADKYPGGYSCTQGAKLFLYPAPHLSPDPASMINHLPRRDPATSIPLSSRSRSSARPATPPAPLQPPPPPPPPASPAASACPAGTRG